MKTLTIIADDKDEFPLAKVSNPSLFNKFSFQSTMNNYVDFVYNDTPYPEANKRSHIINLLDWIDSKTAQGLEVSWDMF